MSRPPFEHYQEQRYFPALDGLRALSVLMVITVHLHGAAGYWAWLAGRQGVTIFFVLSGYLITTLGLREEDERGRVSLTAFYVRRCCRLMPLYYLTIAAYAVFLLGLGGHSFSYLRTGFAEALPYYLVYLPEIPIRQIVLQGGQDLAFLHSWSLGVEEKFYLAWPMLAFVVWRHLPRRRWLGTLVATLALAAAPALLTPLGGMPRSLGQLLFAYYPILAGCALAQVLHDPTWFTAIQRGLTAARSALLVLALAVAHFALPWFPTLGYPLQVLYPLAVCGLLCVVLMREGLLRKLLSLPALVLVGRLSYGVYLVHMLALYAVYAWLPISVTTLPGTVLAFMLTAGLSILAAWVLYHLVERPGIALGRAWSDRLKATAPQEQAAPGDSVCPRPAPG